MRGARRDLRAPHALPLPVAMPLAPDDPRLRPSLLALPRLFWWLWTGQLINRLGSFVMTFLPLYLTERHGYTGEQAGHVLSLHGLGGLAGAALGGWSSDRFGRRPTMLAGLAASALTMLAFARVPVGVPTAVAAFFLGAGNGYGPALSAAITDVVAPADRTRAFAWFYQAVNLGFAIASVAGGALSRHGWGALFVGDAATCVAFAALVALRVPETRPARAADASPAGAGGSFAALVHPRFAAFAAAQLLALLVFLQMFITLPLEERAHGVGVSTVGLLAASNGAVIVLGQPLWLRVSKGVSASRALALSSVMLAAGSLCALRAATVPGYALAIALASAGEIVFSSAAPGYVAHVSPPDRRGVWQGAWSLLWAGATLVAPLAGTALRDRAGPRALWLAASVAALVSAALHATLTRRAEHAVGIRDAYS